MSCAQAQAQVQESLCNQLCIVYAEISQVRVRNASLLPVLKRYPLNLVPGRAPPPRRPTTFGATTGTIYYEEFRRLAVGLHCCEARHAHR